MTRAEMEPRRGDDALPVMPMCHANSLNFHAAFACGGSAVPVFSRPSFDPGLCLRTFADTGATFTSLVPTHYTMPLDVPAAARAGRGFGRVARLVIPSAPARADTKRAVMEMFPNSGLYGIHVSTEAGWVTMLHPHEQFDRLGSVGRKVVGSAPVRLVGEDGCEVPDGEPGELCSCSPYAFDGYWNLPDETARAFRGDCLSVGDMALCDGNGFIRPRDRRKKLIITGGENVYPSEVERVLMKHPGVRDAAEVGCPDRKWGERVVAAVVRSAGARVGEAELVAWSRERLAGFRQPRRIMFATDNEMPRNATGRILHRTVREVIAGRMADDRPT